METSTSSPGLRERKKARTRATIQREALRLFRAQGYAETSVEQIAAAAEVSPSTFFRYYPTKEETVLADFVDESTMVAFEAAPAELDVLDALLFAVEHSFGRLSPEDLELERLRNELIRTVPELRRGQLAELVRPVRLLASAICRREGRPEDDPDLTAYAGALVGGLIFGTDPDDLADGEDLLPDLAARIERIRPILRLPDRSASVTGRPSGAGKLPG